MSETGEVAGARPNRRFGRVRRLLSRPPRRRRPERGPTTGSRVRGGLLLTSFLGLTLPLMPVQAALLKVRPKWARTFPHWYHRRVCRLLGIRVHVIGEVARDRPVLLVANHVSWLDIPVLSSIAPVSFVAKKEVGGWPLVAQLARLQRTVFVDRTRRTATARTTNEMAERLGRQDTLVLFAEGTSSDGTRVLPFKSSLFAAAKPPGSRATPLPGPERSLPAVQTAAIAYTHVHGLPLGRAERSLTGWYGDMDMGPHGWQLLKSGPIDVTVEISQPVPLETFADRKALAEHTEREIRQAITRLRRRK